MRGRRLFARALAGASVVALAVSVVFAAPAAAGGGSVTIRTGQWVGLQINVANLRRGGLFAVKPAQANGSVTSLQPVAQMCRHCAVAINGDFFDPSTREPIGGVIVDGVVLRSPNAGQNQLTFGPDGRISAGPMRWSGQLSAGNVTIPVAVNDPNAASPVLYNRRFGATTPAGNAMELAFVLNPSALYLGRAVHLEPKGSHAPGSVIPLGEVVLRAPSAYVPAMHQLQIRLRAGKPATLHLATDPMAKNSLGANHVLLRDGQLVPIGENDAFVNGANPRTLFGWDTNGRVTLVTIGSAVPGRRGGVSLPIAARLMQNLGVTNAVNLDGGGSSTFVANGRVLNHPSDGFSRAVANAWLVVPRPPPARKRSHPRRRAAVARTTRASRRSLRAQARQRAVSTRVTPPPAPPVSVPKPTTTAPTTTPSTMPAPRRLAERRPALRATAVHVPQPSRVDAVTGPLGAAHHDRWFDVLLAFAVVGFGVAMTAVGRRGDRRARGEP